MSVVGITRDRPLSLSRTVEALLWRFSGQDGKETGFLTGLTFLPQLIGVFIIVLTRSDRDGDGR